jgi:hypothetical protein
LITSTLIAEASPNNDKECEKIAPVISAITKQKKSELEIINNP